MSRGKPVTVVSRRRFLRLASAGIASVAATPIVATLMAQPAEAARPWRAFEFDTPSDVEILIGRARNQRRLHITVRAGGDVVDVFTRANPRSLDQLECAYFTVRYFDPPGP